MKYALVLIIVFASFAQPMAALSTPGRLTPADRTSAQDPTPAPSPTPDTMMDQLKRETELAKQRQAKAEAEKAEFEAQLARLKAATGDPSKLSVPSGAVTTDSEGFVEVKMLSLEAARAITGRLSGKLCTLGSANRSTLTSPAANGSYGMKSSTPNPTPVPAIVIYDADELKAVDLYRATLVQLKELKTQLDKQHSGIGPLLATTDPITQSRTKNNEMKSNADAMLIAAAAPQLAAGLVASVAQLANLFRTETQFQNKTVAISEDLVVSYLVGELSSHLGCSRPAVYYPKLYPAPVPSNPAELQIVNALDVIDLAKQVADADLTLLDARVKVIKEVAGNIKQRDDKKEEKGKKEIEKQARLQTDPRCRTKECRELDVKIQVLVAEITILQSAINQATGNSEKGFAEKYKGWLKLLQKAQSETQFLIDGAGKMTTGLQTPADATKLTPMVQLLRAERMSELLNADSTYMLRVTVSANGTTKIKKNLFVDAKVRHSAGANLVYQLFDNHGKVVAADAWQHYFDYQSSKAIRDQIAGHGGKKGKPDPRAAQQTNPAQTSQSSAVILRPQQ